MNWIPPTITGLKIYPTASDGHCFFKSIQIILQSIGIHKTIKDLREIVATPILNPYDIITNETIKNWIELYYFALIEHDIQLLDEYKHMKGVLNQNENHHINSKQRTIIYKNMLTSEYWGEQHACRIIEEQTQMRFLIFNGDMKKPQLTWYQSHLFKPTHFCFLFLLGQHYMPVSWHNKFIFTWEELSNDLQYFFTQAYKPIKT
jgi:hypothetical protein